MRKSWKKLGKGGKSWAKNKKPVKNAGGFKGILLKTEAMSLGKRETKSGKTEDKAADKTGGKTKSAAAFYRGGAGFLK